MLYSTDEDWAAGLNAIRDGQWAQFAALADRAASLRRYLGGKLDIRDDCIYYHDRQLESALTKRILQMRREGFSIDPMVKFVENMYMNPSANSIEQLYRFLEANNQPITDDGCFLAYKRVRSDYRDVYSGTYANTPGAVISMPRNTVIDDPSQTCSAGLHVASLPYLQHYSGERLMAVKVNPRDVVSVPVDYQNSKMRVCQYEVLHELPMTLIEENKEAWNKSVQHLKSPKYVIFTELPDDTSMYWDGCGWTDEMSCAARFTNESEAKLECEANGIRWNDVAVLDVYDD
jgi:hypothetical protein